MDNNNITVNWVQRGWEYIRLQNKAKILSLIITSQAQTVEQ